MTKRILILATVLLLASPGIALAEDATIVTGTVVSTSPDTLVVRTDSGERTFVVQSDTETPEALEVGTSVTVHFDPVSDGDPLATRVLVVEATGDSMSENAGEPMAQEAGSSDDAFEGSELPQTASDLPLAGLAGLAALGLALAVGFVRRAV